VINNTSLEFGDTGLVCILGESGSGKTTLLNTIGGLDTFQEGSIAIDDITLTGYSMKNTERLRNSKFAYIFQEQYLLRDYTVAYNIRLAMNMYDISEEEREARLNYVLDAVDMSKYKKRPVSQLSGGQQQRIAIARALVKSPEVIFADEPTGNLDEANTMRIMSIIKRISKDCLVILVTHEKRIAEFFADRIIRIEDGKVINDFSHKGRNTYEYSDDTNLYLKEYDKETFQNGNVNINFYSKGDKSDVKLNLVYTDGKLYIQAPEETRVVFLSSETEMQMVDAVKPVLEMKQVEDFDYSLPQLEAVGKARLSFNEIYRLAKVNVEQLGKKQIFMVAIFMLTAFLLVAAAASYMTAAAIDKEAFITEDSHYILINAKRNSSSSNVQFYQSFNDIYDEFIESGIADDIYIDLNSTLYFYYSGYGQIRRYPNTLPESSFVTVDHLKEEDLLLGRMPESRNEIVIDKWIIDVFLKGSIIRNMMTMQDFIDLEVISDISESQFRVVGISNTGEPVIYIDKYVGMSMAAWADKIGSLQQLRDEFPGQYDNIRLAEDEVLVSDTEYGNMQSTGKSLFTAKNGYQYKVAGTYPDSFGVSYVIEDACYEDTLNSYIRINRKFMVYSEEKEPVLSYFSPASGNYDTTYVELLVSDTYHKQLKEFEDSRAIKLNAQFISTVTVFIISMFMLYFTMKSNAVRRAQELTVYRLMGITRRSILLAFILEIIFITSYTVLPVVLVFSGILKFIAVIPSLQVDIVYPWYAVGLLLAFLYVVNITVGLVPVYNIIKLPPAQLAEKAL
jgi:ABC-type lipoprotein export system ATPase subunit